MESTPIPPEDEIFDNCRIVPSGRCYRISFEFNGKTRFVLVSGALYDATPELVLRHAVTQLRKKFLADD